MDRRSFARASLAGLAWPLLSGPVWASNPPPWLSASQLATKVEEAYAPFQSFGALFKQRYALLGLGKSKDSTGSLLFERPDKMRWRYGNGNLVVAAGQSIEVYEKANGRLYVVPPGTSQFPLMLSFLTTPGGLARSFDLQVPQAARAWYRGGYVLSGKPKQPSAAASQVLWFVAPEGFGVLRVVVVDAQGNRNRIDFERPRRNPKVPADSFTFTPPPGTQII